MASPLNRKHAHENHLRRQQRHHAGRPGSRRGDDAVLHRRLLQPQLDVRAGAGHGRHGGAGARPIAAGLGAADPKRSCSPPAPPRATTRPSRARPRPTRTGATSSPPRSSTRPCWRSARSWSANGYEVTFLPVDADGNLDVGQFIQALAARHAAGERHARQQRDRRDLSRRTALAADQGDRPGDRLPHRRHAVGGQAADRS